MIMSADRAAARASELSNESRCDCGHPVGWHRRNIGSCLECGCPMFVAPWCAYTTAANVRCRLDAGHDGAHDTTYMFGAPDALPERPEPIEEPLPEDLERILSDPRIVIDRDGNVAALIAAWLESHPEVEEVPRGAYLALWALYRKAVG